MGVSEIVNDRNYYDMLKNFCRLFVSIGYNGLVINLDEAVNLYNIVNPGMRQRNYEKLLSMYNDCFQGKIEHLFINIASTIETVEDEGKGFYSYDALKTRLKVNKFETAEMRDYAQPVIRLMPLNHNEIFVLLRNLKNIFDFNYNIKMDFSDKDIQVFMEEIFNKPNANEFLTPREVIRDFLNILNILRQNPDADKYQLFKKIIIEDERILPLKEETKKPENEIIRPQTPKAENKTADKTNPKTLSAELNKWKKEISDVALKANLSQMSRISDIISEKNATAGELFFSRHADTLAKLLKQFRTLELSGIATPDIADAKERIRETIALTRTAFEQELKNSFATDMLDVDAEAEAYIQGLKNKGLITQ